MNYSKLVKPSVLNQPVYEPGRPIEDVAREHGLDPAGVLKLASNENPLGASPLALAAARKALTSVHLYPDGGAVHLRRELAERLALTPEHFILGNGSNEIMELLGHAFIRPGDEVVFGSQAFIVYRLITLLFEGVPVAVPMPEGRHDLNAMLEAVTERTRLVFIPSPNNPTGTVVDSRELVDFIEALPPHVVFCFDEAYTEYLDNPPDLRPLIAAGRQIICTRTFSKIYGLAGLRVGYGYADPELIALLQRVRQPFHINSIALAAAEAALADDDFVQRSKQVNSAGMRQLTEGGAALGFRVFAEAGNFVLIEVEDAGKVFQFLQSRGVIARPLAPYGLPNHLRVTVGTADQNQRLLQLLDTVK